MDKLSLVDDGEQFDVTLLEATEPICIVLFAVGAGGNPERHLPLLTALTQLGCNIVAAHFARLASPRPTIDELLLRARRLRLALDSAMHPNLPVVGLGHSIGATILIALAGGQARMEGGQQLRIQPDNRLKRLVLLTPATAFFQAPGALEKIRTPLLVWAGTDDVITPPEQADFLKEKLTNHTQVDVRIVEGAGHFSFMNMLPPQTVDSLPNREAFLAELAVEIHQFFVNQL